MIGPLAHEKEECLYREVKCHNSKNGCDWNGKEKFRPIHELDHCQFKSERCDLCEHFIVKTNIEKHKFEECINRLVVCPNEKLGCNWKIKYCQKLVHVHKQCFFRQEKCQNFNNGCYWFGMEKHRQPHESEECQYFLVKCAFCEKYFCKMEILQHTNEKCPDCLVSCPNKEYGCNLMIKRKDLSHHYDQKNVCLYQKEKCNFCNEYFFSRGREKQNHLQNTCTYVNEMEKCYYCDKMFQRKNIHKHKHGFMKNKKNCLQVAIEKRDVEYVKNLITYVENMYPDTDLGKHFIGIVPVEFLGDWSPPIVPDLLYYAHYIIFSQKGPALSRGIFNMLT